MFKIHMILTCISHALLKLKLHVVFKNTCEYFGRVMIYTIPLSYQYYSIILTWHYQSTLKTAPIKRKPTDRMIVPCQHTDIVVGFINWVEEILSIHFEKKKKKNFYYIEREKEREKWRLLIPIPSHLVQTY